MKTRYLSMIAAAAAIILASSCASDQVEEPQADNMEIRLRADVGSMPLTRAATNIHNSHFDFVAGEGDDPDQVETIHVEILDVFRLPYTFATSDVSGGMEPVGTPPYFPTSGNAVSIYAYYPETVGTVGSLVTCVLPAEFAVQTDQSTADGYKASDLMYAEPATNPVARTEESIPLPFAHKLSKIVVQLKGDGNGVQTSDLVGATVTMKAMTSAPVSTACVATSQTWTSADATDVNMGTVAVNATDATVYETAAIVVPQTIAANSADVFTITLTNGSVYQYTPAKALTIAATTAYQFVFTLSRTAVSVSATIAPWGEGTGDTMNMIF